MHTGNYTQDVAEIAELRADHTIRKMEQNSSTVTTTIIRR